VCTAERHCPLHRLHLISFQNVESSPFVGEDFGFTIRFDNTGDAVGYGPYVDIVTPEHVTIQSMTHLGTSLNFQLVGTFTTGVDPSCLTHPYARESSGGLKEICLTPDPGANVKLYTVRLPYGSFVDEQTAADLAVTASMDSAAPINVSKQIRALGGFYLGEDALDNPTSDPSFDGGFITTNVTPSVIRLTKQYVADYLNGGGENEIAPGSNHEQLFRIVADIANGATITNLVLADSIDEQFSVNGIQSTTPSATSTSIVGNDVTASWNSIVGSSGSSDAILDIRFEVPYRHLLTSNKILDELTTATPSVANSASADGTYNLASLPTSNASLSSNLVIKPVLTQKSVAMYTDTNASGYSPGDTIQYTIDQYIGDYQAIEAQVLVDTLPDGLSYVNGTSSVSITANGTTYVSSISPTTSAGSGPGETDIEWDLTSEGILRGGCVPSGGSGTGVDPSCVSHDDGRSRIRITFRATINDAYQDASRVEHRDSLQNTVDSTSNKILPTNLSSTAVIADDSSSASISIVSGNLTKSIYAVNGSTTLPSRLQPGDEVTYRLQYDVPSTDFSSIDMDDFLPLPMFTAGEVTTFNASSPLGTIPAAGNANFGPSETLYSYLATEPVLTNQAGNVLRFSWASTHDPASADRQIDVLFTVTINDAAYAPGMYITNQATVTENNIQSSFASNSIQQIELEVPELTITKGAVISDNSADIYTPTTAFPYSVTAPGSAGLRFSGTVSSATLDGAPVDSNVEALDAGDIVTFALVLENNGKGDAYETRIRDVLPTGFSIPGGGINMHVSDGAGTAVAYTDVGGGTGLLDQGIELTPAINDAITGGGTNIIVLTYDLQVASTAEADATYTNTAQITKFTAQPAGVNYMNNQASYEDSADVTLESVAMSKSVTNTANADTTGSYVAVGEEITYTLIATIPEGQLSSATLVDTTDACLAITGFDSLTASAGITASNGTMGTILTAVSVDNVGGGTANDGRQLTLDFGTITNSDTNNTVAETITLVYRVVPVNASSCARGSARNNSATMTWNTSSNATISASNVTIQEPGVTITKTFTASGGDAGDTKTVQLVISATSASNYSPAYDIVATDNLTATGFDYVGNIVYSSGVSPTSSGESGGIVTFNYDQLNPGQTSTVRFDVRIKDSVQANSSQSNTASLSYTSMLGTPAGLTTYNALACERTGNTGDCGTTENDYSTSSNASVTITNVSNTKTQVTTSEAHTSGSGVAVGEIVRYRLVSRIPEGTQTNYVLRDAIPPGMSYMNDGTTKAAFVYTSSFTSSTLTDPGLNFIGDETTVASVTPTYVLSGGAISAGANGNGTDVDFNFGTITNTDDDATYEYIVVEFNALVRNESTNVRSTVLNNNFSTRINGSAISGTTSANSGVTVQEPQVTVTKVVTTAPVDAGDTVEYTITMTNTAGTNVETGYEWTFTDTLNTHLELQSLSFTSTPAYTTPDSTGTSGQDVVVSYSSLDPGDSIVLKVFATVRDTAPANFIVPNTGNVTTSSLPGTNGTTVNATESSTPGANGSTTGEENYTGNSSVNTTLGAPTIDKQSPVAGSEYSIGQLVSFPISITVPEGVVPDVYLTDVLPVGLRYESHTIDTSGFSGSFENPTPTLISPAVVPGNNGDDMVLNFGDISTPGTTGTTDSFVVTVTARVTDVVSNYDGQSISNSALLTYTNPNTLLATDVTDSPVVITVEEPRLSLNKTISGTGTRQVGDTLSYTVAISSDGSVDAYEWVLDDTLPAHTSLSGVPSCDNGGNVPISYSVSSGVLTITANPSAGSTLPVGQTITCTYELTIASTAVAGTVYTNTADVDWRNATIASGFGRAYADAVSYPFDGSQDTDTANYTMQSIGISKSDGGLTSAEIGREVDYELTINAPIAVLDLFTVEDTLPAGMVYNNDAHVVGTSSVIPSISSPNDGTAPVSILWDFGSVSHDGSTITITYSARVANVAGNQDGVVLTNTAELSFTPELGSPQYVTDSDSFTIDEPVLEISKSASGPLARLGSRLTYTLDLTHAPSSNNHANDVVITDSLPSGLTYESGSVILPSGWSLNVIGQVLTFSSASFSYGGSAHITYDVIVDSPPTTISITDALTNNVNVTWTSLGTVVSGERTGSGGVNDYLASDSVNVTVTGIDLAVDKSTATTHILPSDTIIYDIQYQNQGNATATSVVLTETVPENTTYNESLSTSGWSCSDGSPANTVCTFSVGTLVSSASSTVQFALTIEDVENIDRNATTIENEVSISSDATDGPDADESNNTDTATTPFVVADIEITKTDTIDPVFLTHDYSYVLTITNNGPDTATNLELEDSLPSGVSYRGYSAGLATCIFTDPTLSCTLGSLANGVSETITVDVTGDTPGNKINTATISHSQQDPDLENNSDQENTFVDPADLEVTKTVNNSKPTVGDTIDYTITVLNNGPDTATNVVATDVLPSSLRVKSVTTSQGTCTTGQTVTCSIGTLLDDSRVTIIVRAEVLSAGTIRNTVSTTLAEYDPNPDNNTAVGVDVLAVQKTTTSLIQTGSSALAGLIVGLAIIVLANTVQRTKNPI
jgi:uncharacterized repeat protein (TIGR01451 family)/fimbrial isopeptide formation D2 family protein